MDLVAEEKGESLGVFVHSCGLLSARGLRSPPFSLSLRQRKAFICESPWLRPRHCLTPTRKFFVIEKPVEDLVTRLGIPVKSSFAKNCFRAQSYGLKVCLLPSTLLACDPSFRTHATEELCEYVRVFPVFFHLWWKIMLSLWSLPFILSFELSDECWHAITCTICASYDSGFFFLPTQVRCNHSQF